MYTATHFHNNPKNNSKHEFDDLEECEKRWIIANLNNIIEKFNEKFRKDIDFIF
jgi:hypothetical protein